MRGAALIYLVVMSLWLPTWLPEKAYLSDPLSL